MREIICSEVIGFAIEKEKELRFYGGYEEYIKSTDYYFISLEHLKSDFENYKISLEYEKFYIFLNNIKKIEKKEYEEKMLKLFIEIKEKFFSKNNIESFLIELIKKISISDIPSDSREYIYYEGNDLKYSYYQDEIKLVVKFKIKEKELYDIEFLYKEDEINITFDFEKKDMEFLFFEILKREIGKNKVKYIFENKEILNFLK